MAGNVVAGIALPEGDPGAIERAASSFGKASNDFASTGQTAQNALGSVGGWQGVASINFRDRCGTYADAAAAGEHACDQAARALKRYGHELAHAQSQVRALQRQAQECVSRINAAKARAATAAGRQNAAAQRMERGGTAAVADGGAAMAAAAREYHDAGSELSRAQGDEAAAAGELAQLQKRAADIDERIKARAKATAGAVGAAAGGLPQVDFPGAGAPATSAGGGGFPWSDLAVAFGAVSKASSMWGVYKALPFIRTARDWQAVAPAVSGEWTLTSYAARVAQEHFPTFNNGFFGRYLGSALRSRGGILGDAGDFLGDASRATPFFGYGLGGLGVALGGFHTYQDFAQGKSGEQKAVDITGTAFSGATILFVAQPEIGAPVVVVAGLAWGGAEAWQHRAVIGHVAKDVGQFVWNTSAPGLLWNNRHAIGHAFDDGVDLAGSGLKTAESGLSKVGDVLNPTHW